MPRLTLDVQLPSGNELQIKSGEESVTIKECKELIQNYLGKPCPPFELSWNWGKLTDNDWIVMGVDVLKLKWKQIKSQGYNLYVQMPSGHSLVINVERAHISTYEAIKAIQDYLIPPMLLFELSVDGIKLKPHDMINVKNQVVLLDWAPSTLQPSKTDISSKL